MRRSFMVATLACAAIGCGDDTEDVVASAASGAGGAGASLGDPPAVGEEAGVDACAPGFDAVDGGCAAVLPSVPCEAGMIAVPGDAACRPIADCGSSTWGLIPVEATTTYVDQSYVGASDGSETAPWTTMQAALDAAEAGAIVAVAEGTYVEDLVFGRAVRLWGRCPSLVTLQATGAALAAIRFELGQTIRGAEVHGLAVTGDGAALAAFGNVGVLIDSVWVHDLPTRGFVVQNDDGPMELTLRGSVVEGAREYGLFGVGVAIAVEDSVVRGTTAGDGQQNGLGILVESRFGMDATLSLRGSIIEANEFVGVLVSEAVGAIDSTLIRDTRPLSSTGASGWGIASSGGAMRRAELTIDGSVVSGNRQAGILMADTDGAVAATTVTDTAPGEADADLGVALLVQLGVGPPGSDVTVERCLFSRNVAGALVTGSRALLDRVWLREQLGDPTGVYGIGVQAAIDPGGTAADVTLRDSRIDGSLNAGVLVNGSSMRIERCAVRDTVGVFDGGRYGWGVSIQASEAGVPSTAVIAEAVITGHSEIGVALLDSQATVTQSWIGGTLLSAADQTFGDGILAFSNFATTTLTVEDAVVVDNARTGVAAQGADVAISGTQLWCNLIAMASENASIADNGGNVCGCDGALQVCKAQSASIDAPPRLPGDQP